MILNWITKSSESQCDMKGEIEVYLKRTVLDVLVLRRTGCASLWW